MITKWKLSNFKSVRQETELALGPLTIFAGSNSSGKSTLLQSILLISQTLAAKVPSRSVVLNGHLAKLGQFNDLRSFGSKTGRVVVGWECQLEPEGRPRADGLAYPRREHERARRAGPTPSGLSRPDLKSVSYEISLNVDSRGKQAGLRQLQPNLTGCKVSCVSESHSTRIGDTGDLTYHLSARKNRASSTNVPSEVLPNLGIPAADDGSGARPPSYKVALDRNSLGELAEQLAAAEPVDCHFTHFLPDRLLVRFDEAEEEARLVASVICMEGLRYTPHTTRSVEDKGIIIQPNVVDLLKRYLGEDLIDAVLDPFLHDPSLQDLLFDDMPPQPTFTISDWQEGVRRLRSTRRAKLRRTIQEVAQEMGPEIQRALKEGKAGQYNVRAQRLPKAIWAATQYSNTFFRDSVKYLGPLRDEPKALYSLDSAVDPRDVGLRGQNTAAVLHLHKHLDVAYIPSAKFSGAAVSVEPSSRPLVEAVLDWSRYLDVAEEIETTDMGKLGHELRVSSSDLEPTHDLTHVGVGVSQVLPILVMCLLAKRGTVLILEQPELHLHPRVQTRLADFFLSMSLLGKQCLIETHSEYLINRLRFRAASAPEDALSSGIKMYFAEKRDGNSSFREVEVNEYGAITDWPEGFFDQSPREAENILRAAVAKRKQEREARKNA